MIPCIEENESIVLQPVAMTGALLTHACRLRPNGSAQLDFDAISVVLDIWKVALR